MDFGPAAADTAFLADYQPDDDGGLTCAAAFAGHGERRMQVRAYNYWVSLLAETSLPRIDMLDPAALPGFAANAVLLHVPDGTGQPAITWLGAALAAECGLGDTTPTHLHQAPAGSLLERVDDHYRAIIDSGAPAGFEAEFVGLRGSTMLYRGILLPFTATGTGPTHVLAVINWKELAGEQLEAQIAREMAPALRRDRVPLTPMLLTDWADGPGLPAPAAELPLAGELVLMLVRRDPAGGEQVLGEVPADPQLIAAAAQRMGL
ncbi:hypothetical protein [Croceibacterium ferulae]|uniref:hypothetical protein n=1 Tax=Croceibacterium ferulae TaxID=1854641 RepID=UPI000EB14C31|nr:hypothetical protein [Croceibacterium ferulae]